MLPPPPICLQTPNPNQGLSDRSIKCFPTCQPENSLDRKEAFEEDGRVRWRPNHGCWWLGAGMRSSVSSAKGTPRMDHRETRARRQL